jgi:hypothetical protein
MEKEIAEIYEFLLQPTPDDIVMVEQRGSYLLVYLARMSKMLADAKLLFDKHYVRMVQENRNIVTSTVMRSYCESLCNEQKYLVNLIESLIKKCEYEIDWCRTLISKAKEEMRLTKN